jgi:hypothetical protein
MIKSEICKFFLKEKESVCSACDKVTTCDGNIWYCDFVRDRRLKEEECNGKQHDES